MSYQKIGRGLEAQGDLAEAAKNYRHSLAIGERLAEADPDNSDLLSDLFIYYGKLGDALEAQGNQTEAVKVYRESVTSGERLAKTDPSNASWQSNLAVSYDHLGRMLSTQGDLVGAREALGNGFAILKALVAKDKGNALDQRNLGALAYSLILARDFSNALEAADLAIQLASPDQIWLQENRAHALMFSVALTRRAKFICATKFRLLAGWKANRGKT